MDRRQRRFVPRLEGSLEDRVVMSTGAAHAAVRFNTGGNIPVLTHAQYEAVVYKVELAFQSYRGNSPASTYIGALWHSLTHVRWVWPDGNKPNDVNALRSRVFAAASQLPYANQQLVPWLSQEIPTTTTQQSSRAAQGQVLHKLSQYISYGARTELFLLSK